MASSIIQLIVLNLAACVCGLIPTFDEEVAISHSVFLGEVIAKRPDQWPSPAEDEDYEGFAYTFRVEKVWKGDRTSIVEVTTGTGGGDCGFAFDIGESYLVFAENDNGKLYTGYCYRTARVADAGDTIKKLRSPLFVFENQFYRKWIMAVFGLLFVLLGLLFFKFRTRSMVKVA